MTARLVSPGEGSKYHWLTLEIQGIIKNSGAGKVPGSGVIEVVQLYDKPEVPQHWCRVHLQPLESKIHPETWEVVAWEK